MRFYTVERDKEGMPSVVVTAEIAFHTSRDGLAGKLLREGITADELRKIDGGSEALERWKAGDDSAVNDSTIRSAAGERAEIRGFSTRPEQLCFEWPVRGEDVPIDDVLRDISHLDFGLTDPEFNVDVGSEWPGTTNGALTHSSGRTNTAVATIDAPDLASPAPTTVKKTELDERDLAWRQQMRELWGNEWQEAPDAMPRRPWSQQMLELWGSDSREIEANESQEATHTMRPHPRRWHRLFSRRTSRGSRTANGA
jgi:hypothetical protein